MFSLAHSFFNPIKVMKFEYPIRVQYRVRFCGINANFTVKTQLKLMTAPKKRSPVTSAANLYVPRGQNKLF